MCTLEQNKNANEISYSLLSFKRIRFSFISFVQSTNRKGLTLVILPHTSLAFICYSQGIYQIGKFNKQK